MTSSGRANCKAGRLKICLVEVQASPSHIASIHSQNSVPVQERPQLGQEAVQSTTCTSSMNISLRLTPWATVQWELVYIDFSSRNLL